LRPQMDALCPPDVDVEQQVAYPFPSFRLSFDFPLQEPKEVRTHLLRKPLWRKQPAQRTACFELQRAVTEILPVLDFRRLERPGLAVGEVFQNSDNRLGK
jgi:hypothetical protein